MKILLIEDELDLGAGSVAQAYATGCYSLKENSQAFGLHYATVSRVVRAVKIESE